MSEARKFNLIKEYKDCVLLQNKETLYYTVKERFDNDSIIITPNLAEARQVAETYSLEEIIKVRYEKFAEVLKRIAD